MFRTASLVIVLQLVLSIAAVLVEDRTPLVTLPIAKRISDVGGALKLLEHDQRRAAALKGSGAVVHKRDWDRHPSGTNITHVHYKYTAAVRVGSPATTYNLIVDIATSNTWVGATVPYKSTGTSKDTGESVNVKYGTSYFAGEEWLDTVTLGPSLTIINQSIGVASVSHGFNGVDGILGLGPVNLTRGTLNNSQSTTISTVTQNLYSQGTIPEEVVSVSFEPTTNLTSTNGELTFGGTDASKYTGTIAYTPVFLADYPAIFDSCLSPLTKVHPASNYWGIDQSITYGNETILNETAGVTDILATLILIASDAFDKYQSATGGVIDPVNGYLRFTSMQYHNLHNLDFKIGSVTYTLTPNGQIWPRALNTYIQGSRDSIYSIVNSIGRPSGNGLDFISGLTFLERFYSVFDTKDSRVGFATTKYTDAVIN